MTSYRSDPVTSSNYARGRAFPTVEKAKQHASRAATAYRIGYQVWEIVDGHPKKLATFPPPDGRR